MKKIIAVAIILVTSNLVANARDLSDQDINMMSASAKAVDTYKKNGMGGLFSAVSQCYGQLKAKKKSQKNEVEFCVALDVSGIFIDDGMSRANGFPRDPRFTDAEASNRIHGMLQQFGMSKGNADTQAYLGVRTAKIQRFTNLAMQL